MRGERGDRLELIAESDPRKRQGRENKPGAKLHPFPQGRRFFAGSGVFFYAVGMSVTGCPLARRNTAYVRDQDGGGPYGSGMARAHPILSQP